MRVRVPSVLFRFSAFSPVGLSKAQSPTHNAEGRVTGAIRRGIGGSNPSPVLCGRCFAKYLPSETALRTPPRKGGSIGESIRLITERLRVRVPPFPLETTVVYGNAIKSRRKVRLLSCRIAVSWLDCGEFLSGTCVCTWLCGSLTARARRSPMRVRLPPAQFARRSGII